MTKLISHQTTETLPSGTTITTLHLTPKAKRGLSTNGATIPPQPGEPPAEPTVYYHQQRLGKAQIVLHAGTFSAIMLALLGVQLMVCAMVLSMAVSISDRVGVPRQAGAQEAGAGRSMGRAGRRSHEDPAWHLRGVRLSPLRK